LKESLCILQGLFILGNYTVTNASPWRAANFQTRRNMKMKTILIVALMAVTAWVTLGTVAPVSAAELTVVDAEGITSLDADGLQAALAGPMSSVLSENEVASLMYMREEEKLAHDVYVMLYQQWGLPLFNNIANSEATHTSAVKVLLERYGIADPAAGNGVGEFTDPTLQKLYDQLVAQGSQSLTDALKVGAAIEEIDILDLQTRLAQTANADIELVYGNLLKGSRNHLRAFTSTLQRQTGEIYTAQYLDGTSYNSIVGDSIERGGRRWGNR
jgi:hypothetical protein